MLSDEETFTDLKFRLSKSQMALLERSREVLSHGGHVPSREEILTKALEELWERRDPLKKASNHDWDRMITADEGIDNGRITTSHWNTIDFTNDIVILKLDRFAKSF